MLGETGVGKDLGEIVALRAHRERSSDAGIRIRERIRDRSARDRRLAELIIALKNVRIDRTVRTVGPSAPELAIVVAVMAVGAEKLCAHDARGCQPLFVEHIQQQAGLRQRTGSGVRYGMARSCGRCELRNQIQRIGSRHHANAERIRRG